MYGQSPPIPLLIFNNKYINIDFEAKEDENHNIHTQKEDSPMSQKLWVEILALAHRSQI